MSGALKTAYLSLGSNVGDRAAQLQEAVRRLAALGEVGRVSTFYETEPMEFTEQPWFLNCAVELRTSRTPNELMRGLLAIEREMGRVRDQAKGPRRIDIDLLLFDQEIVDQSDLKVPHPAMQTRRFVLVPLAEIAPQALHPIYKKNAAQMLSELGDLGGVVRKLKQ